MVLEGPLKRLAYSRIDFLCCSVSLHLKRERERARGGGGGGGGVECLEGKLYSPHTTSWHVNFWKVHFPLLHSEYYYGSGWAESYNFSPRDHRSILNLATPPTTNV